MSEYLPTIGLEIHAELKTATKMFCNSKNDSNEASANVNICPVCLAHPGVLPVINREAVHQVLRVGTALGGTLADYTEFDRKNYFYPDLPKGYQLSQYEYPLVSGGELHGVAITRVHLEEDTASSIHDEEGTTVIDYNRAGVPLMELVTEPVIKSAREAASFARELQLLLRYLGASDADMEKGEMRVEANVSISKKGKGKESTLGTKVEIKNLNSFRAMERAVEYELKRQQELLERGEKVVQETRGWDEGKQVTFAQRIKEGSADYRYFPDPDLPSLKLSEIAEYSADVLRASLPELPSERRKRYLELSVKSEDADLYTRQRALGDFFEQVAVGKEKEWVLLASNYIANDLVNHIRDIDERETESRDEIGISASNFRKIIDMLFERRISSRTGKDLIKRSIDKDNGEDPSVVAEKEGLYIDKNALSGGAIEGVVGDVISKNSKVVEDFRAGKAAALEFLVGQCMKALKGAADAETLRKLLKGKIGS